MNALKPFLNSKLIEAGTDEAGRGCLSGPVCAAAVILPNDFYHPLLNDSKQISEKNRNKLRPIIESEAISWAVAWASPKEIDKINILKASILSMHRAISKLNKIPEFILVDGNKFYPYEKIPHQCVIKGDSIYASIAAASILAKTHRDEYMENMSSKYPEYHWNKNKGYPTALHRKIIQELGTTPLHRKSFQLIRQSELFKKEI
jgi:ribonuclease HII